MDIIIGVKLSREVIEHTHPHCTTYHIQAILYVGGQCHRMSTNAHCGAYTRPGEASWNFKMKNFDH